MSLDFDLSKIKNYKEVCWEDVAEDYIPGHMDSMHTKEDGTRQRMKATTSSLIWVTLAIGIGKITEQNVDEFYARLRIWEGVIGGLRYKTGKKGEEGKHIKYTYEEVRQHIGLHTNVGKDSWTVFLKKIRKKAEEDVHYARRNYEKRLEEDRKRGAESDAPAAAVS